MIRPRILCVDDEPRVLEGIQRNLYRSFDIVIAGGGAEALSCLDRGELFEVVVSDMQMPLMNGATLLSEFRKRVPDTTRVLLTGHADIDSAIAAVNRGQIFRFLTKPCPPDELSAALDGAVAQHRLVSAEKVLLEQTLVGSVRALSEVLAMVQPEVFGRTMRQHTRVRAIAVRLGVPDPWHLEVASMLSLVGYAVLPSDVALKLQRGTALDAPELEMVDQVPGVIERVLSLIPRLETVREVLKSYDALRVRPLTCDSAPIGAQILFAVSDLAQHEASEGDLVRAMRTLRATNRHTAPVVAALVSVCAPRAPEIRALALKDISSGMILAADVKTQSGMLLMAHGQLVTAQLLQRIRNFHVRVGVIEPISCEIPRPDGGS